MATPKKETGTVPVYGDDEGFSLSQLPAAPEPDEDEINLSNVLADLGGESDAKVNVYRKLQGKADEFVATYAPAAFSLEDLQANYGGGQYHVQVRANGRLVTRRIVNIATPIKPQFPLAAPAVETEKILTTMQQGFQSMGQMLLESVKAIVQNQSPQKTTLELLQEMTMMKQLLGGNENKPDPVDVLMKNFELFKTLNPSDREPGAMDAILEGLKTIGPVLAQGLQQNSAVQMPRVPAQNMSVPLPVKPQPQANPLPENTNMNLPEGDPMSLAQSFYVNMLVQNAKSDNDPETYAMMMLDTLGEQASKELLNMPDWFERLTGINPEAANYRPWFEQMRQIAIEELTAIEESDKTGDNDIPGQSPNAIQLDTEPLPENAAAKSVPVGNS